FAAAGGVPDDGGVPDIKRLDHGGKIGGVAVHVVAGRGLTRAAMASPVERDHAETVLREEQHLAVPGVGAQWPAVRERDDRACAPVFVVDCRAILHGDGAHVTSSWRGSRRRWRAAVPQGRASRCARESAERDPASENTLLPSPPSREPHPAQRAAEKEQGGGLWYRARRRRTRLGEEALSVRACQSLARKVDGIRRGTGGRVDGEDLGARDRVEHTVVARGQSEDAAYTERPDHRRGREIGQVDAKELTRAGGQEQIASIEGQVTPGCGGYVPQAGARSSGRIDGEQGRRLEPSRVQRPVGRKDERIGTRH